VTDSGEVVEIGKSKGSGKQGKSKGSAK
jgi:hypothetical protein